MRRIAVVLCIFAALGFASSSPARAVQSDVTLLLDLDNNTSTGCTISGFAGVEQRVLTTVQTTGTSTARVSQIQVFDCSNTVLFTDTPVAPQYQVGVGNGTNLLNVIETYWPTSLVQSVNPTIHAC